MNIATVKQLQLSIEAAEPGSIRPNFFEPTASPRAPSLSTCHIEPALPEPAAPPLAPAERVKIDKSVLALNEPTRIRDQAHLKFVAAKPCLICGRNRAQAHHLRFAQPKAMGSKVSDEYTVPLCSLHHRLLHQTGNEIAWWEYQKIDPLAVAAELWRQSRAAAKRPIPSPVLPQGDERAGWRPTPPAATARHNRTRRTHPKRLNQTAAALATARTACARKPGQAPHSTLGEDP